MALTISLYCQFSMQKAIPSMAAAWMQRWVLFLSAYQYDIDKGSKQHANVDGLSRLPIQGSAALEDPVSVFQPSFVDELAVTASEIAVETSRDDTLATVYQYVMKRWPIKPVHEKLKTILPMQRLPFYRPGLLIVGAKSNHSDQVAGTSLK